MSAIDPSSLQQIEEKNRRMTLIIAAAIVFIIFVIILTIILLNLGADATGNSATGNSATGSSATGSSATDSGLPPSDQQHVPPTTSKGTPYTEPEVVDPCSGFVPGSLTTTCYNKIWKDAGCITKLSDTTNPSLSNIVNYVNSNKLSLDAIKADAKLWAILKDSVHMLGCYNKAPDNFVSGRYIKLSQPTVGCLNLTEIEVYNVDPNYPANIKEIASTATITKSSGYQGDRFQTKNFIDRNKFSFIHTSCDDAPWVLLDFKQLVNISKIILYNRMDCCQSRANGIVLTILDESMNAIYTAKPLTDISGNSVYASDSSSPTYNRFIFSPPSTQWVGDKIIPSLFM